MSSVPDTRASLILRLVDPRDVRAWDEFVVLYHPVIYRLARRRGLQHADAEELVQEVLIAVARAVENWSPEPSRGRFRDWLHRIARNLAINFLTRRKHQVWGSGDSDIHRLLETEHDREADLARLIETEYRREVFRIAARRVKADVQPKTWQAFWLSGVDGIPIEEVARRLDMSAGSVYIARCRVTARLRHEARCIQAAEDPARAEAAP